MFPKYDANSDYKAVIAHRGGAGLWPENTLYALDHVKALGADWSEVDVRCSKDGVFVLMHDKTVNRTTNGRGRVEDLTLAQLKALDAGFYWTNDGGKTYPYRGQNITIPTLEEIFTVFPGQFISLELKFNGVALIPAFYKIISKYAMQNKVLVSSFYVRIVHGIRVLCPNLATAATRAEVRLFLTNTLLRRSHSYSSPADAFEIPGDYRGIPITVKPLVEAAHQQQKRVDVWTINGVAKMRHFLELDVDGLITDFPDKMLHLLGRA